MNVTNELLAAYAEGNGNGLLGGLFGCNNGYRGGNAPVEVITSEDKPISRYEAKMMQELSAKDGEIALLGKSVFLFIHLGK